MVLSKLKRAAKLRRQQQVNRALFGHHSAPRQSDLPQESQITRQCSCGSLCIIALYNNTQYWRCEKAECRKWNDPVSNVGEKEGHEDEMETGEGENAAGGQHNFGAQSEDEVIPAKIRVVDIGGDGDEEDVGSAEMEDKNIDCQVHDSALHMHSTPKKSPRKRLKCGKCGRRCRGRQHADGKFKYYCKNCMSFWQVKRDYDLTPEKEQQDEFAKPTPLMSTPEKSTADSCFNCGGKLRARPISDGTMQHFCIAKCCDYLDLRRGSPSDLKKDSAWYEHKIRCEKMGLETQWIEIEKRLFSGDIEEATIFKRNGAKAILVTGQARVGKTYVTRRLVDCYKDSNLRLVVLDLETLLANNRLTRHAIERPFKHIHGSDEPFVLLVHRLDLLFDWHQLDMRNLLVEQMKDLPQNARVIFECRSGKLAKKINLAWKRSLRIQGSTVYFKRPTDTEIELVLETLLLPVRDRLAHGFSFKYVASKIAKENPFLLSIELIKTGVQRVLNHSDNEDKLSEFRILHVLKKIRLARRDAERKEQQRKRQAQFDPTTPRARKKRADNKLSNSIMRSTRRYRVHWNKWKNKWKSEKNKKLTESARKRFERMKYLRQRDQRLGYVAARRQLFEADTGDSIFKKYYAVNSGALNHRRRRSYAVQVLNRERRQRIDRERKRKKRADEERRKIEEEKKHEESMEEVHSKWKGGPRAFGKEAKRQSWLKYLRGQYVRYLKQQHHINFKEPMDVHQLSTKLEKFLDNVINSKYSVVAHMFSTLKQLIANYFENAENTVANKPEENTEALLEQIYGGAAVHSRTNEDFYTELCDFEYEDLEKLLKEMEEEHGFYGKRRKRRKMNYEEDNADSDSDRHTKSNDETKTGRNEEGRDSAPSNDGCTVVGDSAKPSSAAEGVGGDLGMEEQINENGNGNEPDPLTSKGNEGVGVGVEQNGGEGNIAESVDSSTPPEPQMRKCNKECRNDLPDDWGIRIHAALFNLSGVSKEGVSVGLEKMKQLLFDFSSCNGCPDFNSAECIYGSDCEDNIKLINSVSAHFAHMRSMRRLVYKVRECFLYLCRMDTCVAFGRFAQLERLVTIRPKYTCGQDPKEFSRPCVNHADLVEEYSLEIESFKEDAAKLPRHPCPVCNCLKPKLQLISLTKEMPDGSERPREDVAKQLEKNGSVLNKLLRLEDEYKLELPFESCNSCAEALLNDRMPQSSRLNQMCPDRVPKELLGLNDYEKLLIARARTFHTVTKLRPRSKFFGRNSELVPAKHGVSVSLPLNTENTAQYVNETMPNKQYFEILVDGPPTKHKVIWSCIVNMDKVNSALLKLQEINPLYKDIQIVEKTADEVFGEDEQHQKSRIDENYEDVENPNLKHMTEEEREMYNEQYTVKDLAMEYSTKSDIAQFVSKEEWGKYRCKRVVGEPISEKDDLLEPMCFPHLFPNGCGQFFDKNRSRTVSFQDYCKSRLTNVDPRFRKDTLYLFYLLHHKEMKMLDQGVYATLRTCGLEDLNAGKLREMLEKKEQLLEGRLTNLLAAIRGTEQFWQRRNGDLRAFGEKWGPSTFFITLSCAEYKWASLASYLDVVDPDSMGKSIGFRCATNATAVTLFFEQRFKSFMDNILAPKGRKGAFGCVEHYVWRLEFQQRGAPHVHLKIWCKDAPKYGESSDEEVLAYIQKYITCELPNPIDQPELHKLVKGFQMHKCGSSCLKGVPNRPWEQICRYGFPRTAQDQIGLNSVAASTRSRVGGRKVKRLYDLARKNNECFINDYNPLLLLLWEANIDVQFVGESSQVLDQYITGYITKGEKNSTDELWEHLNAEVGRSVGSKCRSLALQLMKKRQIGAYEAVSLLMGHSLIGFSSAVKYVCARKPADRRRVLKSNAELEKLESRSDKIFRDNTIDVYYPNRHDALENYSLYEILSRFDYSTVELKQKAALSRAYPMKNGIKGHFSRRMKEADYALKYPQYKSEGPQSEQYFYQMLLLFKPFREESELIGEHGSAREAYREFEETVTGETKQRLDEFKECQYRRRNAQEIATKLREQANAEVADESLDADQFVGEGAKEILEDFCNVIGEKIEERVAQLNEGQFDVYEHVTYSIRHQLKHELGRFRCSESLEPLRMFVSGVGGTGKSFLIQIIRDKIVQMCQDEFELGNATENCFVAVLAPTGVAAFNISGQTMHRMFLLPVQKKKAGTAEYTTLSQAKAKELRMVLRKTKLFIVDEISMVGNNTLAMVHRRLEEILLGQDAWKCTNLFAGANMLFFGDLLQLPPVKMNFCFLALTKVDIRNVCGGISQSYSFWEGFKYAELLVNVRQAEDKENWSEILNRIRIGSPTAEDIDRLRKQLLDLDKLLAKEGKNLSHIQKAALYFHKDNVVQKERERKQNCICLLPTNEMVEEFNMELLKLEKLNMVRIPCEERTHSFLARASASKKSGKESDKKNPKKEAKKSLPASECGGLEEILVVAVGARVMLRRNISVEAGYVNGALGRVVAINRTLQNYVSSIEVLFDHQGSDAKPVRVERIEADFERHEGVMMTRVQFPLHLAYGMTIHKSQGISCDSIMADLGACIFTPGQAYVALSRCRKLENVKLIGFMPNKLHCDDRAYAEYKRLRALADIEALPSANNRLPQYQWRTSLKRTYKSGNIRVDNVSDPSSEPGGFGKRRFGQKREGRGAEEKNVKRARMDVGKEQTQAPENIPKSVWNGPIQLIPTNQLDRCIRFSNTQNHCFSNAAIQGLLSLDPVRLILNDDYQSNSVCWFLREYMTLENMGNRRIRTVLPLRRHARGIEGHRYTDGQQHDADEFLSHLMQQVAIPVRLLDCMTFQTVANLVCSVCNHDTTPLNSPGQMRLTLARRDENLMTFQSLFQSEVTKICTNLNCPSYNTNTMHNEFTNVVISPETECLVVLLRLFRYDQVLGRSRRMEGGIVGFDPDRQNIGGVDFETVAAIRHEGRSANAGHYTCWRRIKNGWVHLSDTEEIGRTEQLAPDLRYIKLLFLRRLQ